MTHQLKNRLHEQDKEQEAILTPEEEKEIEELLNAKWVPPYQLRKVSDGTFAGTTWKWVPTGDPMPLWWQVICTLGYLLGFLFCLACGAFVWWIIQNSQSILVLSSDLINQFKPIKHPPTEY